MASARTLVRGVCAAVVTALLATTLAGTAASATASGDAEDALYRALIEHRADHDLPSLRRNLDIENVARTWSSSMAASGTMSHNPSYFSQMPSSGKIGGGENVAYSCGLGGAVANAERIMGRWIASPGHNANMLRETYTHIGIGVSYVSSRDCVYATQNFGRYSGSLSRDVPTVSSDPVLLIDVSSDPNSPRYSAFHDEIRWAVDDRISRGWANADGTRDYRPERAITRDAMAAFLYRLAGSPAVTLPARSPFADVTPSSTAFYQEIVWLYQQGISTGWTGGGTREFRPTSAISRDAMAAFLYRFAGEPPVSGGSDFDDVAGSAFEDEIAWLAEEQISTGWRSGGETEYRPLAKITRDAMAAFLFRYDHR